MYTLDPPPPVTVTTRIITFVVLVGISNQILFATWNPGWGVDQMYTYLNKYIPNFTGWSPLLQCNSHKPTTIQQVMI